MSDSSGDTLDKAEDKQFQKLLERLDLDTRESGEYYNWIRHNKTYTKIQDGKIVSLDLSWLAIQILPTNFLKGLNHLTTLRLDNNPHISFEKGCFDNVPNLKKLRMQYCNLTEFPQSAFSHPSTITELDISQNPIEILHRRAFQKVLNIQTLEISGTKIGELQPHCFDKLQYLTNLNLKNNHIKTIADNSFEGLSTLQTLDLRNNEIQKLSVDAFLGLDLLTELRLDNNDIRVLPTSIFAKLPQIEYISLVNNKITSLDHHFSNHQNLKRVDLDTNLIDRIQTQNFMNSPSLSHIMLQSNLIKEIDPEVFHDLPDLEIINVQDNPLTGEQVLQLPPQALFNYHALIDSLEPAEIYRYVVKYHKNSRFIDQVLQSGRATDKIIAFLRLVSYDSP